MYLEHYRLAIAGHTYNNLFSRKAAKLIYQASKGIPRVINMLCHKSLLSAYRKSKAQVDRHAAQAAIKDNEEMIEKSKSHWGTLLLVTSVIILVAAAAAITLSITL